MKLFLHRSLVLLFLAGMIPAEVLSQAVLEEREWTNSDGKKIRAELLGFESDAGGDLVRLRLKSGNTFKVKPETLSRVDQAVILKARFEEGFRSRYSESLGAHFFYSNEVDRNDDGKSVAYIGNDHKSAWMRIKVSAHSGLVDDGVKVLFIGDQSGPVRLDYDTDDTERSRSNSIIDLSLTKQREALSKVFSNPAKTKIYIETATGSLTEVKLSDAEKLALRDISSAFRTLSNLTTDHTWWTTFQGLDPAEYAKMVQEKSVPKVPAGDTARKGPVLPLRDWVNSRTGELFEAEVTGFDRHMAIFQREDGSTQSLSVEDVDREGREAIGSGRLNWSLYEGWHPFDDEHDWFWPQKWTNPSERIEKQILLFAVSRETGEPALFLQQRLETKEALSVTSCRIKSEKVSLDLDLPAGGAMKLRGSESTKVWIQLGGEFCDLLLVAAPGMESMQYDIAPSSGPVQSGTFSKEEFAASMEAIEIYRIRKSLVEKDTLDPFSGPNRVP